MYIWGLTIDLVSCIALQLAVGLCVDYAAHIGHTFLKLDGTKTERAMESVLQIGEAVLSGGGSTILALAMLWVSDAYIFQAFFKVRLSRNLSIITGIYVLPLIAIINFYFTQIFMLVVVFGLFHGIVFLPVLLSIVGPQPYEMNDDRPSSDDINGSLKRHRNIDKMEMDVNELKSLRPKNGFDEASSAH